MNDVLTKEEREFVEAQRFKHGQGIWTQIVFRLVEEVERLRSRNEKFEKLLKAELKSSCCTDNEDGHNCRREGVYEALDALSAFDDPSEER